LQQGRDHAIGRVIGTGLLLAALPNHSDLHFRESRGDAPFSHKADLAAMACE
jgi:hypothetical protein